MPMPGPFEDGTEERLAVAQSGFGFLARCDVLYLPDHRGERAAVVPYGTGVEQSPDDPTILTYEALLDLIGVELARTCIRARYSICSRSIVGERDLVDRLPRQFLPWNSRGGCRRPGWRR